MQPAGEILDRGRAEGKPLRRANTLALFIVTDSSEAKQRTSCGRLEATMTGACGLGTPPAAESRPATSYSSQSKHPPLANSVGARIQQDARARKQHMGRRARVYHRSSADISEWSSIEGNFDSCRILLSEWHLFLSRTKMTTWLNSAPGDLKSQRVAEGAHSNFQPRFHFGCTGHREVRKK